MAGAEPLTEKGSPPHCEAQKSSQARDGGKDGWIKKRSFTNYVTLILPNSVIQNSQLSKPKWWLDGLQVSTKLPCQNENIPIDKRL